MVFRAPLKHNKQPEGGTGHMVKNRLDPVLRAQELHQLLNRGGFGQREILVADFSETLQGKDTSRVIDLMSNHDHRFLFRVKFNAKDVDPLAAEEYGKDFVDIRELSDEQIQEHLKRQEFDFALWFKHVPGFSFGRILDYNVPFIVQVAGCNFHDGSPTGGCRFCFVDNESNDGIDGPKKVWLSVNDCLDSFLAAREKVKKHYLDKTGQEVMLRVLRISGGEPTLVIDWIEELWQEIERRGLLCNICGQVDTNLSTGSLLSKKQLARLARYPIKFLAGMKGCDSGNIAGNVQAIQTLTAQMKALRDLVDCGLDVYPQLYSPNPDSLRDLLEMTDAFCVKNFSLRLHIGPLKLYGPNRLRLELEAEEEHWDADTYIEDEISFWEDNYKAAIAVLDDYLSGVYGCRYKDTVRSDVRLVAL